MNTNRKKIIPLLGLAAFLATTPVIAYDDDDHMSDSHKAQHAVPPAQYPPGEDNLTFFIGAAYTYWVPYQEGLNYALQDGSTDGTVRGTIFSPRMDGCSGFKVGLGANTNHDGWNVALNYTWFYNPTSMHQVTFLADGGDITNIWDQVNDILAAQSRFSNQFNRIDGVLDRAFYAGHYLAFRPWIGLLGAWENQNFDFDVELDQGAAVLNVISFTTDTESFRNHQFWWGIGPYAGVDATFYFTNEWGLFLSSGVSMLLVTRDVNEEEYRYTDAGEIGVYNLFASRTSYNVEPMIENSLGLRWDSFWTDWALRVEVAWEMQTYFSHNGILSHDDPIGYMGNYSMQGLTAGLRVNF